jgi:membrane dipeptidase
MSVYHDMNIDIGEHARQLHESAIVIDGHSDILKAVTDGTVRLGERTVVNEVTTRNVYGHYDLPRWLEGGTTAQVCALYIDKHWLHAALQRGLDMVADAYEEIAQNEQLVLATTVEDIRRAKEAGKVAIILSFEGADPLGGNLKYMRIFYQLGVRMISLTHARRNYFSGGVERGMDELAGLSNLGMDAIRMCDELGIVVDMRHLDARAINQILEISQNPVIMSHINARQAFPHDPDDAPHHPFSADKGVDRRRMMQRIASSGGMICIIFWKQGDIHGIVDDIEYVVNEVGPEYVGLGTDLYGFDHAPKGAEDVSKFPYITELLVRRGFSDEQIYGILGQNMMRVFEAVWK